MLKILSKRTLSIFLLSAAACLLLSSCENPFMQKILDFKTVSFNTNGGSSVPAQNLIKGWKITQPDDPVKFEAVFDGWYKDNYTFLYEWDFDDIPAADMTLHAKWIDERIQIPFAAVTVTAPETGQIPAAAAEPDTTEGEVNFSVGDVSWSPAHNPFRQHTRYTVSVTLSADEGYTFTGLADALINGQAAGLSDNTGSTVTLSLTFGPTEKKDVSEMEITTQPQLAYTSGDTLDLSELVIRIFYEDGSEDFPVIFEDFDSMGIETTPAHGETLSRVPHNEMPVTVTLDSHSVYTDNLIVKEPGAAIAQITVTGSIGIMNTVTVSAALAGDTGQSVEYSYNTVNSVPAAWHAENSFVLTDVDKVYYVFARSASSDIYSAGAPSVIEAAFYTVSFDSNGGGTDHYNQIVFINGFITTAPPELSRAGYNFTGWYKEQACENEWNFETDRVTGTLTLYAGWEANIATITLSIEEIVNGTPVPSVNNVILSKANKSGYLSTQTISIDNPNAYNTVEWRVAGVGASNDVTVSGNSFTLDANAVEYGTIGGHTLMLTVTIGGNQYMVNIRFTIVE